MKKNTIILALAFFGLSSCVDLDLNPLDQGSSENWYSSETQFEMAINDFYRLAFWKMPEDDWCDDYVYRNTRSEIVAGTLNSEDSDVETFWNRQYKAIARAHTVISNLDKGSENGISETVLTQYEAESRFMIANHYAMLVFAFGDVVYVDEVIDLDEAYTIGRTSKEDIIEIIYDNFDFAIDNLPTEYSTKTSRATKGAALALKARWALYFGDYDIAAEAANECIELGEYSLHSDYSDLFLIKNAGESIFLLPRSIENDIDISTKNYIPRNAGGWAGYDPSWALLACYECTDGLPIDESPLFDPRDPFKNRDPRCTATIVEFGTTHMGIVFTPHPDSLEVMNYNLGSLVTNNDTRANAKYASYNGLVRKKGIDESWGEDNNYLADPDEIIIRYADVLLIYAEAKIELNEIDESVLEAINTVRARAYGVDVDDINNYPAVQTTDQDELRKKLRLERRMEFAFEGVRYYDIIRWEIAEETIGQTNCGLLYPSSTLRSVIVDEGLWFWPSVPPIDENGVADFSEMVNDGYVQVLSTGNWDDRQYLWPIPAEEIIINENMIQNSGY